MPHARSEIRKPVLRVPFAEALSALYRLGFALFFAQVAVPRAGNVDAFEGGVATECAGGAGERGCEFTKSGVAGVGTLHGLREGVVAGLFDAVEPFLARIFAAVGVAGGIFGVFEDVLLVSL